MSQPPNSNQPSYSQPMRPESPYNEPPSSQPQKNENTIGMLGFIVSLVGLFLCGIPSLIGLILSAIGMKKEPRGMAIAGLVIGLIGIALLVGTSIVAYQWYQIAKGGLTEIHTMLAEAQLEQSAAEIGARWQELERIPTQEEGDEMLMGKNDMMNNSLVYRTDGTSFSIRTAGADEILDTPDDIVVGPFEDPQTAIDLESDFEDLDFEFESAEEDEVDDASKPGDLMEN